MKYILIDNIDEFGNRYILPLINELKNKIYLLKIIVWDYFIRKNWFINLILLLIIYELVLNDSLEGALYGALLTFNLIGGYNYYIKIKEWENVKPVVSSNIQDFISSYRVYMQGHRFPVKHHFLLSEHFTKDTLIESKILKDQSKSFNEKLSDAYSEYEELFSDMLQKSNEIEMDEDQLKKYIEFLVSAENKINQSIIVSIAIFDDKIDLVIELQKLYNLIHRFLMYYNFSAYQHSNNFIEDCLRIIKQNKNVLELLD